MLSSVEAHGLQQNRPSGEDRPNSVAERWIPEKRITTLQWAVGFFCALTGALMVVVPNQFSGPVWGALQGQLPWVGSLFLLAGVALVGCTVVGASHQWVVAVHLFAASALLALVYNLVLVGLWPGAVFQIVLAIGTAMAPFVSRLEIPECNNSGYLFAFVFGAVNVVYGLMMLLFPGQFGSPVFNPIWSYLSLYGVAFFVTGALLMVAQVRPGLPSVLFRATHLAILVPSVAYALAVPIPSLTWTGIIIYCGLSPLVASLPWTGPALKGVEPRPIVGI